MKQIILLWAASFAILLSSCTNNEEQIVPSSATRVNITASTGGSDTSPSSRSAGIISKQSVQMGEGLWADMVVREEIVTVPRASTPLPINTNMLAKVYDGDALVTTINYMTTSSGKAEITSGTTNSSGYGVVSDSNGKRILVLEKNKNYRFVAYTELNNSTSPDDSGNYSASPFPEKVMNFSGVLATNADQMNYTINFKPVRAGLKFRMISKIAANFNERPQIITFQENMYPSTTFWNWIDGSYNVTSFSELVKDCNVTWISTPYEENGITTDSYTMTEPIIILPGAQYSPLKIKLSFKFGDITYNDVPTELNIPKMEGNKSYKVNMYLRVEGQNIIIKGENEDGSEPV